MHTHPTRMSVKIHDNSIDQRFIVPVVARSPEEARRRALANYCGESQSSTSLHAKLVREGKLSAEVVEVGGNSGESTRSPCPGPFHPLNFIIGFGIWAAFIAMLYVCGVFDWFSRTS